MCKCSHICITLTSPTAFELLDQLQRQLTEGGSLKNTVFASFMAIGSKLDRQPLRGSASENDAFLPQEPQTK